jgi:uncharacterized protein with LGFP repeats
MHPVTKRAAAFSAATAVIALIGVGCTDAKAPSAATPTSTQIAGSNGTKYTVEGPVLAKYQSLDAATRKSLGAPKGNEDKHPDGGGFQEFDGGEICVHGSGSYVVLGQIRDKWDAVGGMDGKLGFPTSDETSTPDGGKKTTFEHGTITWKPGDPQATVVYS